jgi:hypothetical protein
VALLNVFFAIGVRPRFGYFFPSLERQLQRVPQHM